MLSKRFALIVGGTIGGLGAVLSITPPQFGSSGGLSSGSLSGASLSGSSLSGSTTTSTPATTAPVAATTPAPAATPTKKASTKKASTKKSSSTTSSSVTAATPTPAATTVSTTTTKSSISGTFTGDAVDTRFGAVQVRITIANGKITNVTAPQYPTESFRDQQINAQAIPWLEQQTIAAQSANIQGVGGASYTSEGFYQSLVSALSKAGM